MEQPRPRQTIQTQKHCHGIPLLWSPIALDSLTGWLAGTIVVPAIKVRVCMELPISCSSPFLGYCVRSADRSRSVSIASSRGDWRKQRARVTLRPQTGKPCLLCTAHGQRSSQPDHSALGRVQATSSHPCRVLCCASLLPFSSSSGQLSRDPPQQRCTPDPRRDLTALAAEPSYKEEPRYSGRGQQTAAAGQTQSSWRHLESLS